MVRPQQSNPRPPALQSSALQTELILPRLAIISNKLQNKNDVSLRGNRSFVYKSKMVKDSQRLRLYKVCLFPSSEPYNPPLANGLFSKKGFLVVSIHITKTLEKLKIYRQMYKRGDQPC